MVSRNDKTSELLEVFRRMWLIRAFEEKASLLYAERQIAGLVAEFRHDARREHDQAARSLTPRPPALGSAPRARESSPSASALAPASMARILAFA